MDQRSSAHFTAEELGTLQAMFDVIIPPDSAAGGWAGGVSSLLAEEAGGFMKWCVGPLQAASAAAFAAAQRVAGVPFAALDAEQQHLIFEELERDERSENDRLGRVCLPSRRETLTPFMAMLVVAYEGYYGGTSEPAGWGVANFAAVPAGVRPVDPEPDTGIAVGDIAGHYDVIVVGAGAGGGPVAAELAESGRHVLLLERGRAHRNAELRGNHLQGKRLAQYDVTAGAGVGSPRVLEQSDGSTVLLAGDGNGFDYGLVAMTLGGGTRLWQGMSWRFYPEDFRMADEYGVPADSSLANWPFGYDELAPYYDLAEWQLGVSGDGEGVLGRRTPRAVPYPMPPMPDDETRRILAAAGESRGWETTSIPFAINTVPSAGRPACVRCSQCIGHACPVDAKNGSHNTFVPRARASGNADLLTGAQAISIEHDGRGTATGVTVMIDTAEGVIRRVVRADQVVVAAGAIETPRLILASGLANEWVGRNHHSHGISIATAGVWPEGSKSDIGPGHSVATLEFVHRNKEAWGGGVMFDQIPSYPLERALGAIAGSEARYGQNAKDRMRDARIPLGAMSMVQEVPHAAARISLDPKIRDRYGMPVPRAFGVPHHATVAAVDFMTARAVEWVESAGGRDIRTISLPGAPQGAEHSAGTARMGDDPARAACDAQGRLFGTRNVYVADASLHPTNGGFNPALTVVANALRVARLMLRG